MGSGKVFIGLSEDTSVRPLSLAKAIELIAVVRPDDATQQIGTHIIPSPIAPFNSPQELVLWPDVVIDASSDARIGGMYGQLTNTPGLHMPSKDAVTADILQKLNAGK